VKPAYPGQWSQEGDRLRLRFDLPPPPPPAANRPANPPPVEAVEKTFEIMSFVPEQNMLLLRPTEPRGSNHITFYRVN
jgi:hypothetical protein